MNELVFGNWEQLVRSAALGGIAALVALVFAILVVKRGRVARSLNMALCLVPCALAIASLVLYSANIPYDDDYNSIVAYAAHEFPERLRHLCDFNWDHRMFLTNLCSEIQMALTGHLNFQWLMALGNSFIVIVVFLIGGHLRDKGVSGVFTLWALMFLALALFSDYFFWPMATLSNYGIVLFAYLAFLLARRRERWAFPLAAVCAVVCTLSAGSGCLVWPCLYVMIWTRPDCSQGKISQVLSLLAAVASVGYYFSEKSATYVQPFTHTFQNVVGYFFTFAGGWTYLPGVSFVFGVVLVAYALYSLVKIRELKHPEVLMLAGFILGTMAGGAWFRSVRILVALPPRHPELPIVLLGCVMVLLFDRGHFERKTWKIATLSLFVFAVGVNVFSFFFFGSIWRDRLEIDRRNLLVRPYAPEFLTSLTGHPEWSVKAVRNLDRLEKRGVYNSLDNRRPGEQPPDQPIDRGGLWTPGRNWKGR